MNSKKQKTDIDNEQDTKEPRRSFAFEQALRALDTLEDINLVLVPNKPTLDMLVKTSDITGLTTEQVAQVYTTMIKISQEL